ncbi:MAG TPA: carbohydrate-binding family 9-like protein [Pyrinomonadaceae bacterium]
MIRERSTATEVSKIVGARYAETDIAAGELDHPLWATAESVSLHRYWSGEEAPAGRWAEARLLWSDAALCVRFVCRQKEPLVVSNEFQTERKTIGLWERDVCEIFIAPDTGEPSRYFEFEAAPTGEWLDLAVLKRSEERETDWDFHSGMTVAARIREGIITIAMRLPWEAMGRVPRAGERWRANLFRCIGEGPERGYLAWQPTYTDEPCFHVPEAFGELRFEGQEPGVRSQEPEEKRN